MKSVEMGGMLQSLIICFASRAEVSGGDVVFLASPSQRSAARLHCGAYTQVHTAQATTHTRVHTCLCAHTPLTH